MELLVKLMKPFFWEDLAVTIDGDTFEPYVIETFFKASRGQRLHVIISPSDPQLCALTKEQEHERLMVIMKLLAPRFRRLHSLSVETVYRSTIVAISRFFDNVKMPQLTHLRLVPRIADDDSSLDISSLECPHLYELHIDPESFLNLAEDCDFIWPSGGDEFALHITSWKPTRPSNTVNSPRFIQALRDLGEARKESFAVEIQDVSFNHDDFYIRGAPIEYLYSLRLQGLTGFFLSILFEHIDFPGPNQIYISHCDMEGDVNTDGQRRAVDGDELHLDNIRSSTSLLRMIQDFRGFKVRINDCPGFNDWVLGAMAFVCEKQQRFACSSMTSLSIKGCTFSPDALKCMCEMRLGAGTIEDLDVSGAPPLDEHLRAWFVENVDEFS
ncbi:hypothetical protein CONPUDRAFT_161865 [Coniophora puteana RWD-64-598 SS2]|uniref:F-box domain-containing protein n=1 Tax=Coniophora puteana (strain RWD-64-598) TaxID=741705 RepID=A0A5M3N787_CONPW|nr:uncharacterized protein CONPUDRAFT_161865 [Coniophora puteana RWD-64-598 SS2]EIW87293.1 hypothetical protein CONPUDRAFT_161865 [Coniophora puteana RWD-64-598 SS2]